MTTNIETTQQSRKDKSDATDRVKEEGDGTQVLTFILDNEDYGVEILRVQEIKRWETVKGIPNNPE